MTVLASEDLVDWTHAGEVPFDAVIGRYDPGIDPVPPKMFFKYRILIDGN